MKAKHIIEIQFCKKDLMRYISHLDLIRLFQRAANRADLPLEMTCGFHPHPKMSITPALKLGQESQDLLGRFALSENMLPEDFKARLQKELPQGLSISKARSL
jgi:radical SAM-linked protein